MHTILIHDLSKEKPHIGEPDVRTRGFLVGIEPPISVTKEIVDRVVKRNSMEPRYARTDTPFEEVTPVGSTDERTTLYARLRHDTYDQAAVTEAREDLVDGTTKLLRLLGVNEIAVETMPKPDTHGLVV